MSFQDLPEINSFFKLEHALACLTVYRDVAEQSVLRRLRGFLGELCRSQVAVEDNIIDYSQLLVGIMKADIDGSLPRIIAREILLVKQPLNELMARHEAASHPMAASQLSEMAAADLTVLQTLAGVTGLSIKKLLNQKAWEQKRTDLSDRITALAVWQNDEGSRPPSGELSAHSDLLSSFVHATRESGSWSKMLPDLFRYHQSCGYGEMARYRSFVCRDQGLEALRIPQSKAEDRLLDYHGCFAELVENTERFAAGKPSSDTIVAGLVGVGKHSIMRQLVERFSDDKLTFIYLETMDPEQIDQLMRRLESNPRPSVIIVDSFKLGAATSSDQLLARRLRQVMAAKPDSILLYILADVSQKALINGKLIDRKALFSLAGESQEALIASFPKICHLRLPSREESSVLLDHLARGSSLRLSEEERDGFFAASQADGLLGTPAQAEHYVRNLRS